jgi:hypothetical protein
MKKTTLIDLTGKRFHQLTVIGKGRRTPGSTYWNCRCDCGQVRQVASAKLRSGRAYSCGCTKKTNIAKALTTHGQSGGHTKGRRTAEYRIWGLMVNRCHNPKNPAYPDYGGRGIMVCERWRTFENFFADMGPRPSKRHTIDRTNNSKGYEPGNVRWATMKEQANNTRGNRIIEHAGLRMTLAQWAQHTGIRGNTIARRIDSGVPAALAMSTPPGQMKRVNFELRRSARHSA